ncbi:MAG: zinc ribbon domain-containing protein [Ruminiclostridium sp.]|nr:zinc ribbon domain-containing protein [Ruminiclostridium sp.]
MKRCINCGAENKDENTFCSICGGQNFSDISNNTPPAMMPPPPMPQAPIPPTPKKPFGIFDVLTILGFVSSIVGLWGVGFVLEPIGVIASILGFFKGTRYKGLAAAGMVIAIIAFIIRLFITLYDNNIIGRWAVDGILFYSR